MTDQSNWTGEMCHLYLRAIGLQQSAAGFYSNARELTAYFGDDGHAEAMAASMQRDGAAVARKARASLFYLLDLQRWYRLDVEDVVDALAAEGQGNG